MFSEHSASTTPRVRTAIARGANGQPRTYRLTPRHEAAYRLLAVAILGLDVGTLTRALRATPRHLSALAA